MLRLASRKTGNQGRAVKFQRINNATVKMIYMGTRCLRRAESERIIVEGFLEPMSRSMSYQVRAWISYLIESKWEGKELSINNDEQLKSIVEVEETRYNENAEVEQHYKYR